MDFISRIRNQEFISKSLRKAFLSLQMVMIASKYMSYTRRTGTYTFSCPHLSKQLQFCLNVKKKICETHKITFQSNSILQVSKHGAAMVSFRAQLYSFSAMCEHSHVTHEHQLFPSG